MQQKTGNLQDAEDLVQDAFVKAYRNIHRYRASFCFSTWLFTIAMRLANSHYRRRRPLQTAWEHKSGNSEPDAVIAQRESRQSLWALAERLPENQYQALWLKYAADMSIKEIAKVMRKSQVCVKVLLYRARVNLAEQLNKQMTDRRSKERFCAVKV